MPRKKEVEISPDLREGEEFQGASKRQWLLPPRFLWSKGSIKDDISGCGDRLWRTETNEEDQFYLDSDKTFAAFKELAECIETPGLLPGQARNTPFYNNPRRGYTGKHDILEKSEEETKVGWLRELWAPVNEKDLANVRQWVKKYGLPSPDRYAAGVSYYMCIGDVIAIAHLASTAYRLFEYGRYYENRWRIKQLSVIDDYCIPRYMPPEAQVKLRTIYFCAALQPATNPDNPESIYFPPDLGITIDLPPDQVDSLTKESWRRIAWLWISRVCNSFIEIELQSTFTEEMMLRPVLKPIGLLSWLWLHFLSYVGEADMPTQAIKTCQMCGASYTGSRSPYCPRCLPKVKAGQKSRSKRNKEMVLTLRLEGKTSEEVVAITGLTSEQVSRWFNSKTTGI